MWRRSEKRATRFGPDIEISDGKEVIYMKKLLLLGMVAGAVAAVAVQWPEIQRYLKIRNM